MIFFGFILVIYQTGLWEKYLVTGDWSQSTGSLYCLLTESLDKMLQIKHFFFNLFIIFFFFFIIIIILLWLHR